MAATDETSMGLPASERVKGAANRHLRLPSHGDIHSRAFLLKVVQPGLSGLMDGSLSTLAPIFAVAFATHRPLTAFYTGLATALGAGVSMAFSEGLSDTGDVTGRGKPVVRGAITGGGTFLGGVFHTLPFLIGSYQRRDRGGDPGRGYRATRARMAALQVLPDQLRPVVRRGRSWRRDHCGTQRCARHRRRRVSSVASSRYRAMKSRKSAYQTRSRSCS